MPAKETQLRNRLLRLARPWLAAWLAALPVAVGRAEPAYPAIAGMTDVQSLDIAAEGGAVHLLLVGRFAQRQEPTVAHVLSADGGKTWSAPAFVNGESSPPPISRRGNDARLAVSGRRLVAVWQSKGELPGTGPMAVAVSEDGGRTWAEGANPAVGDGTRNQNHMDLTTDPEGHVHLSWLDDREENGNTQGVRYAKSLDGGRHWLPEATLDAAACTCCWNTLATLPDRSIAVLYRDSNPHDMQLARLRPGAGRWEQAGPVGDFRWEFNGCPHCGGSLAATGTGKSMALHGLVWTGKEGAAGLYYLRSGDAGRHWTPPLRIGDGQTREGDIAARSGGKLALAYLKKGTEGSFVVVRHSADNGRGWTDGYTLNRPGKVADHPRVAATPDGYRVFWTETAGSGGKLLAISLK